jgi:hypothetical protein
MIAQDFDQAVWLLAPLAVLALARAVTAKGIDVFHVAWLAAVAVLVVTLADIGAWFNHTLDVAFLTVLLAAGHGRSDSASVTLRAARRSTVAIGLAGAIFTPADGTFSPEQLWCHSPTGRLVRLPGASPRGHRVRQRHRVDGGPWSRGLARKTARGTRSVHARPPRRGTPEVPKRSPAGSRSRSSTWSC